MRPLALLAALVMLTGCADAPKPRPFLFNQYSPYINICGSVSALRYRSLFFNLTQGKEGESREYASYSDSTCLDPSFVPSKPGIALIILGSIVFAYSMLGDRIGLDFNLKWPDWCLGLMLLCGVTLLVCGLYLLTERLEPICKDAQQAEPKLSISHAVGRFIGG